jgi:hypothetical protein
MGGAQAGGQAQDAPALIPDVIGRDVLAGYLHGSAVTGGLRPDSDLDLLVVTRRSLPEAERRAIVAEVPGLLEDLEPDTRNVLLTLARVWVTLDTGEIRSKDAAADWAIERLPAARGEVLALARDGYLGSPRTAGTGRWLPRSGPPPMRCSLPSGASPTPAADPESSRMLPAPPTGSRRSATPSAPHPGGLPVSH